MAGFRAYPVSGFLLAALVLGHTHVARAQGPSAQAVVTAAREALGGEQRLSAMTSFTATGRTRQLRGNNLVPIEFEINCELPDKFVRKDEIPAQDTDAPVTGFVGIKQDFARLILGIFAASFSPYPLTFKYLAEGDAPACDRVGTRSRPRSPGSTHGHFLTFVCATATTNRSPCSRLRASRRR